jgi:hypothetical protein
MLVELIIFIVVSFIYLFSSRFHHTEYHFFVPLAQAFLKGRLYVEKMTPFLHEMVTLKEIKTEVFRNYVNGTLGMYFVILPPFPAIILMPFVLLFGMSTNQSLISTAVAALNVVLFYKLCRVLELKRNKTAWLVVFFSFGSMQWYHGVIGSGWYFAQIAAMLFVFLAVYSVVKINNIVLSGVFLGLAYLCRYGLILSFPFFIINSALRFRKRKGQQKILTYLLVLLFFIGMSFLYNYLRYQTIWHVGYKVLEQRDYNLANEYSFGSYSLTYFPRHFKAYFLSLPERIKDLPFIKPNLHAQAIWTVMPAVVLVFLARFKERLVWSSWLAIFLISLTHVFHGGIGATQFGYRYAMDYFPFLFLIIIKAAKEKLPWWGKALIIASILLNSWGIYYRFWQS